MNLTPLLGCFMETTKKMAFLVRCWHGGARRSGLTWVRCCSPSERQSKSWWNHSWKRQCINSEIPSHSWSIFGDRIISLAADQTRSYRVHLVKAFDLSEILWSLRHKRIQKPPNNPLVQLSHAYPIQSTVVSNCEAVSQSSNYVIVNLCSFFSSSASFNLPSHCQVRLCTPASFAKYQALFD